MEQPRMQSVLYLHSFADSIVDDLNLLCHSFRGRFPFTLPSKCINNMLSTVLCQVEEFNWKRRRRGGVWSTWSGVCDKDMNNWMPVPIPANARCPIWKPRRVMEVMIEEVRIVVVGVTVWPFFTRILSLVCCVIHLQSSGNYLWDSKLLGEIKKLWLVGWLQVQTRSH